MFTTGPGQPLMKPDSASRMNATARLSPAVAIAGAGAPRPLNAAALPWFVNNFASQDWLMIGYLCALLVALGFGKGANRGACMVRVGADLGIYLCVLTLVRLPVVRWGGLVSPVLYRLTVTATLLA